MTASLPQSLVLIGAGKMGGAMLEGWLRIGIAPAGISLIDPKWKEQRDTMLSKIRETTKASDDEIGRNLLGLARHRPDVFGTSTFLPDFDIHGGPCAVFYEQLSNPP